MDTVLLTSSDYSTMDSYIKVFLSAITQAFGGLRVSDGLCMIEEQQLLERNICVGVVHSHVLLCSSYICREEIDLDSILKRFSISALPNPRKVSGLVKSDEFFLESKISIKMWQLDPFNRKVSGSILLDAVNNSTWERSCIIGCFEPKSLQTYGKYSNGYSDLVFIHSDLDTEQRQSLDTLCIYNEQLPSPDKLSLCVCQKQSLTPDKLGHGVVSCYVYTPMSSPERYLYESMLLYLYHSVKLLFSFTIIFLNCLSIVYTELVIILTHDDETIQIVKTRVDKLDKTVKDTSHVDKTDPKRGSELEQTESEEFQEISDMVDLQTKLIETCSNATIKPLSDTEETVGDKKKEDSKSFKKDHNIKYNLNFLRYLTWLRPEELNVEKTCITVAPGFEPMMNVIDRISVGQRVLPNESMRYEMLRLCSFRTYPSEDKPYLIRFAQAGFYYASNRDEVVCYCCGKRISNWKAVDSPMEIHRRVSPSCSFVINNSAVNVNVTPRPGEGMEQTEVEDKATSNTDNDNSPGAAVGSSNDVPALVGSRNSQNENVKDSSNLGDGRVKSPGKANGLVNSLLNAAASDWSSPLPRQQPLIEADTCPSTALPVIVQQQKKASTNIQGPTEVNCSRLLGNLSSRQLGNSNNAASDSGPASIISQPSDSSGQTQQSTQNSIATGAMQTNSTNMYQADVSVQQPTANQTVVADSTPNTGSNATTQLPKHPRFATAASRLETFRTCQSIAVSHEQVSEAGFYYAGTADCTRCFHCGIGLRHWSTDDDPWVEHARFSIDCDFVRRKKGEEFVHLIRLALAYTENNMDLSNNPLTGIAPTQQTAVNAAIAGATTGATSSPSISTEMSEDPLETIAALSVKEMGYSDELVKRAMQTIATERGRSAITATSIMEQIFVFEDSGSTTTNSSSQQAVSTLTENIDTLTIASGRSSQPSQSAGASQQSMSTLAVNSPSNPNVTPTERRSTPLAAKSANRDVPAFTSLPVTQTPPDKQTQRRKLKKENETMKMMSVCSKCKTNDVCIVFLPCGHLITCADCAPSMKKCSQCGQVIKGTVRTYRS